MKPPRPTLPPWMTSGADGLDAYVDLLATDGVDHGLIGPREVPRLWSRHILNCAVVADPSLDLVPMGTRIADVGSGAGLPGLVWAIVRPDITVVLVEPLLRRSTFLTRAIERLDLVDRVQVVRGRAEDVVRDGTWVPADVVTARAVAPLDRLLTWTIPLLRTDGLLVALKGSSAADEIVAAAEIAGSMAVRDLHVVLCGAGIVDPPTTVVVGVRGAAE